MKKVLLAVLLSGLFASLFAQDVGIVSSDTLSPPRTVVIPSQLNGVVFERTYTGDSVLKYNDKIITKQWWKRAGSTVAFDSCFVIQQMKTRRIDTVGNGLIPVLKSEMRLK